jgi:integrase
VRGSIRKRGKTSWALKFDLPAIDGKRRTRYATVKGTRQDAQRELTRLLGAADAGTLPEPSARTLADYLCAWLDSAHEQSPKTLERYKQLAHRQIIPHLGATKLQQLKPEAVRQWHSTLLGTGLSPRTVGHAHRLLRLVLGYAVKAGTLTRNVAAVHSAPKAESEEIEILTPEQIKAVLDSLKGHSLHPIVSLALATGMRRGELLGLQWRDVDLDAGALRVERSLEETDAGLRLKNPKTKRGRRNIKLPAQAAALLREHRKQQLELRIALGMGKLEAMSPVFCNVEGQLLRPRNVTKAWSRVASALSLKVSFHALRHTHVSMLIREGVDILSISRRIGHSKAATTLDVYGHLVSGVDDSAAKAIEGVLK